MKLSPPAMLALGSLIAAYRYHLLIAAAIVALVLCAVCGLLTVSLPPEYNVSIGNLSAGVRVEGCRLQWGYVRGDGVTVQANDSGEWRVC